MNNCSSRTFSMIKLINKSKKKREEEICKKVNILTEKMRKMITLNNYFLKNTTVNILERIIVICLNDVHASGIAKTQDDEIISYRRYKNSIRFHINKSSYTLFIVEE